MRAIWNRLRRSDRGASVIEYGLIAALVSLAIVTAFSNLLDNTGNLLGKSTNAVTAS